MIRVELPQHLRTLARVSGEISVDVHGPVSIRTIVDGIETRFPMLRGTIRDHRSGRRRDFVRFFVCGEDWSNVSVDDEVPAGIARGEDVFLVIGAIAGG